MLGDTFFTEESYVLSANKKSYEVHMVSFWLNERPCFRVYIEKEAGNLFTWDAQTNALQQMDGLAPFPSHLLAALEEKIAIGVTSMPASD